MGAWVSMQVGVAPATLYATRTLELLRQARHPTTHRASLTHLAPHTPLLCPPPPPHLEHSIDGGGGDAGGRQCVEQARQQRPGRTQAVRVAGVVRLPGERQGWGAGRAADMAGRPAATQAGRRLSLSAATSSQAAHAGRRSRPTLPAAPTGCS
jgi:hypothetical protein